MSKETIPMIDHLQLQTELNDLNQKYQNLRQESSIMCDEIQTEEHDCPSGVMASFHRLCNLLER